MNVKALVPVPARRLARQYHQRLALKRALGHIAARVEAGELPSAEMRALSYGWANEGFSAEAALLAAAVRHAALASGPVLECGSGLSTILLALATRRKRTPVMSLENDAGWARRVREWLPYDARHVRVQVAPLERYDGFDWYAAETTTYPSFSLVVCDGPPGATRGGRYGLVPVMRKHFAPGCVILLDDANRNDERATAERWADELGASLTIQGDAQHALATLVLPG
jgi:hypothetical protein